jgi:hypothetical protein
MTAKSNLFLTHKGISFYHAYKEDHIQLVNWYSTDPNGEKVVDIRKLPVPQDVKKSDHAAILKNAVDKGLIKTPEATREM